MGDDYAPIIKVVSHSQEISQTDIISKLEKEDYAHGRNTIKKRLKSLVKEQRIQCRRKGHFNMYSMPSVNVDESLGNLLQALANEFGRSVKDVKNQMLKDKQSYPHPVREELVAHLDSVLNNFSYKIKELEEQYDYAKNIYRKDADYVYRKILHRLRGDAPPADRQRLYSIASTIKKRLLNLDSAIRKCEDYLLPNAQNKEEYNGLKRQLGIMKGDREECSCHLDRFKVILEARSESKTAKGFFDHMHHMYHMGQSSTTDEIYRLLSAKKEHYYNFKWLSQIDREDNDNNTKKSQYNFELQDIVREIMEGRRRHYMSIQIMMEGVKAIKNREDVEYELEKKSGLEGQIGKLDADLNNILQHLKAGMPLPPLVRSLRTKYPNVRSKK